MGEKLTIREFYERTEGDYAGVMGRFEKEERVGKYLRMFTRDQSFEQLEQSLKENNGREAFLAAHTLKGVCLNMGFSRLYSAASDVTEALRGKDSADSAEGCMPALRNEYHAIIEAINDAVQE